MFETPTVLAGIQVGSGRSGNGLRWLERVFFTLFPKITQVCVKVNCYTILCKIDEVFTQSNVGVLTFYTMLCKNVNLYTGLCNDSISCICDKFYTNLCNFTQSCVSLH